MNEKNKQSIPEFKLDDFFKTQEQLDDDKKKKVEQIDISLIDEFKDHPFRVIQDEDFNKLKESIKENGIFDATIVRKKSDGRYEMISGHRRLLACKLLNYKEIPCIVEEMTREEAIIRMVDSNIHREKILPSEKGKAYRMKYEAMKHQGVSSGQIDQKLDSSGHLDRKLTAEIIGDINGESEKTVRRYIRLTYLVDEIQQLVDNSELNIKPQMAMSPAIEISYLSEQEQRWLLEIMDKYQSTPSHAQAITFKEMSKAGSLTKEELDKQMNRLKPNQIEKFKINEKRLFEVIPRNIERDKVEDFVLKACDYYSKHLRQKNMER